MSKDRVLSEKPIIYSQQPSEASGKVVADLIRTKKLVTKFNELDVFDQEGKYKVLCELLHPACREKQPFPFMQAPFYIHFGYNFNVGANFFSNFGCVFLDDAPITIGDNCMIAPGVHIYAGTHPVDPKARQEYAVSYPVNIGHNVWLGGKSVILPGVTIGDNVTIGAGSVVTKDIPSNVLAVGNPAKVIRRFDAK